MLELSTDLQHLLQQRLVCFLATIMPDGSPQMTQTWVNTDGTYILINSVVGHQKVRNVQRDPRITLSVIDPAHWERAITIRGRVVEMTTEGADLHFKHLVQRYLGQEGYPYGRPGQWVSCSRSPPKKSAKTASAEGWKRTGETHVMRNEIASLKNTRKRRAKERA